MWPEKAAHLLSHKISVQKLSLAWWR